MTVSGLKPCSSHMAHVYKGTGDGTWYVVVHAGPDMNGSNDRDLLCGNLFS
jgi:hypothetical protein